MKNANKHLVTIGLVTGSVILAGYAMSQFNNIDFVAKAQNGFQGVV
ncbi:MAG: hypothetical protein ACRBDL_03425 [Alphaproteobacteria bacterium]